ncbi:Electron transfer DM13 [Actinokineospora alba]|uniref:Electron transfer DM13 n=1 Tax=Actinokineospora alba TaxID=504798 RepID=A0A1H0WKU4_9PSEU|nr:DM13 domain-containing protein [Actinokineospora alba]TDP66228.1 electron transfer DM13 [Actinokineospora alba]SDJ43447.1 Electron transfer DM13 [Actinokineospora alba]SDP91287.1 Electron transfer DM13 [Actinokineospora alba]
MRDLLRRRATKVVLVAALVLLAGGLWAFQPWKIFTRSTVDEALPAGFAATTSQQAPATTEPMAPASTEPMAPTSMAPPAGPKVLAEGAFRSHEHPTAGTARVLEQNGTRLLRLEGFSTSDGPDVHVWLSDAKAGAPEGAFDDGRYVKLGKLKATDGNQNYEIPAGTDLAGLSSVVIWCDRFNVAFGAAPLPL